MVINDGELLSFPNEKTILSQDEKPDFVAIQNLVEPAVAVVAAAPAKNLVELMPIDPQVIEPVPPNDVSGDLANEEAPPAADKDEVDDLENPKARQLATTV